jgi:Ca2+-binding EF-hand superfamily protein
MKKSAVKQVKKEPEVPIELLNSFRAELKKHGARGIHGLGRKFKILDTSGNRTLTADEFAVGLQQLDLKCSSEDSKAIFAYFDKDGSGSIDYEEFIKVVKGKMNDARVALVKMAFAKFDRDGSGVVTKEDVVSAHNPEAHPAVLAGERSPEDVHCEFLETFDVGDHNGKVTLDEFVEYYNGVSASVDDDSYFELMIRNAWHIVGGVGQSQNTSNLRVLCFYEDGSQKIETVVDDFGLDLHAPGASNEVIRRLEKQGLKGIVKVDWSGKC